MTQRIGWERPIRGSPWSDAERQSQLKGALGKTVGMTEGGNSSEKEEVADAKEKFYIFL